MKPHKESWANAEHRKYPTKPPMNKSPGGGEGRPPDTLASAIFSKAAQKLVLLGVQKALQAQEYHELLASRLLEERALCLPNSSTAEHGDEQPWRNCVMLDLEPRAAVTTAHNGTVFTEQSLPISKRGKGEEENCKTQRMHKYFRHKKSTQSQV